MFLNYSRVLFKEQFLLIQKVGTVEINQWPYILLQSPIKVLNIRVYLVCLESVKFVLSFEH